MGMYDIVIVSCPVCGEKDGFQSKSGECLLIEVLLEECPDDILSDVNRHSPYTCYNCGTLYEVDKNKKISIEIHGGT